MLNSKPVLKKKNMDLNLSVYKPTQNSVGRYKPRAYKLDFMAFQ